MSRLASITMVSPARTIALPVIGAKPTDPYILTNAEGLGPPEIDISIGTSVYRGGVYQGSFPQDREIVLLVNLNMNYAISPIKSISEMRAEFYTLISGPDPVSITIKNTPSSGGDYVPDEMVTRGYIRRIEAAPFTKDPQLQLTIICPSPFFELPTKTSVPFTPNTPSSAGFQFQYDGTAVAGFQYSFKLTTAPNKVIVASRSNFGVEETITIPGPRAVGDLFAIDTDPGVRQVYWTSRDDPNGYGDITGMCLVTPDRWPSLHPGDNVIQVRDELNNALTVTPTKMEYTTKYWGL